MAESNEVQQSLKKTTGWNEFYRQVAPSIKSRLDVDANIGKVSTVASKMWRQLGERRNEWKDEAQRKREDLDTGITDIKKQCTKCGKYFNKEKNFRYHSKGCMVVSCSECVQVFSHTSLLKTHMDKVHRKTFECDDCGKCFSSKRNLTRHQVTHTGEKLPCNVCGTLITTKSNMNRHVKEQHPHFR